MEKTNLKQKQFIKVYFEKYITYLSDSSVHENIILMKDAVIETKRKGKKVYFAGNGASAAIAGHAALDFTKQAKIVSSCFNEASLITAFANDFGYAHWLEKAIEFYCSRNDMAVLISSSGKSENILNAANAAKKKELKVITFSGFLIDNPLRSFGDINFWLDCRAYNVIENIHQIWLMTVCDLVIGSSEYSVS